MPALRCDRCRSLLPGAVVNTSVPVACPGCQSPLLVQVFPALLRPVTAGPSAEVVSSDEDASCFYHPRKKAVVPCADCGRFLCALCDLEIDGAHICPACLEKSRPKGPVRAESTRQLHDNIALSVAILPALFVYPTLISAPIALFLAIRYWNEPRRSPVPRSRWRLIVAGLIAFAQIAGWVALFYSLHLFIGTRHR